jgi:hypothetical protein
VPSPLDRRAYKCCKVIERLFCRLKNCRRLATRAGQDARDKGRLTLAARTLVGFVWTQADRLSRVGFDAVPGSQEASEGRPLRRRSDRVSICLQRRNVAL